jgi:uncharacterized protein YhdP
MSKIKALFLAILILAIFGVTGILAVSHYLSTGSVQAKIERQFTELLQTYYEEPDHVSIGSSEWAGLKNPLSIHLKAIDIQHKNYTLQIKHLKLGVSLVSLLKLAPKIKQITVHHGVLAKDQRPIAQLHGVFFLDLPAFSYRIKKLTCNLKDLSPLHPQLASLETLDLPITLQSKGLYENSAVVRGTVDLSAEAGTIKFSPYYPQDLPISKIKIQAVLDSQKIDVFQIDLKSKDLELNAQARLEADSLVEALKKGEPMRLAVTGKIHQLPIDEIKVYWPVGLANKARQWVTTNLSDGVVEEATLALKGHLLPTTKPTLTLDQLGGTIDTHGVTVRYLGDLPKVSQAKGHCTYSKENFVISVTGLCEDMELERATLVISGLDRSANWMDINLTVRGQLESALKLVSQPPLTLPQKLGLDLKPFTGEAVTDLTLSFPLKGDLPLNKVRVDAHSQLRHVTLTSSLFRPLTETPLSEGELDLRVTNDQLTLTGTGIVANHSAKISATRVFESRKSQLTIEADDQAQDPYLGNFKVGYTDQNLSVTADLSKVDTQIPELKFVKKSGDPGALKLAAKLAKDNTLTVSELDLTVGQAHLRGQGQVQAQATHRVDFDLTSVIIGDLRGRLSVKSTQKGLTLSGTLHALDLDPILKNASRNHSFQSDLIAGLTIESNLQIQTLSLGNKLHMKDVQAFVLWKDAAPFALTLTSAKPGQFEVYLAPPKNNQTSLHIACDNAGALIDYFSPNSDFQGGHLTLVGTLTPVNHTYQLNGEVDLRDITVIKAPFLAQILSLSSLEGILRTLTGQGIQFDHTTGKIHWQDGKLMVEDMHASGSAIALSLTGTVDTVKGLYDLTGDLYPLNSINLFLANIPLLGFILSGGKQRGIFSTAFTIKGPRDHPRISVNPLSTIAPQGVKEAMKPSAFPEIQQKPGA